MLSLRFLNSGIRAKVFVRKIDFKLRVMRLNRVESFYALLLRFCIKCSEEGQPAKPPARVASHGQTRCRGGWPWPSPLHGPPPTARCSRLRPRPPERERLDAAKASPQGLPPIEAVARRRPLVGAAAARGHGRLQLARKGDNRPLTQPLAARCP
ncbi:hypothetical protein BHM03_00026195 [Ensete ventricosum]|uniref:Uncharacterized protein n=1 Tax=Ensete ventricosum TaxID=4639 RepID=A0A445MHC5_ENSVE|nr:hypothetical protein BHM03_00026195 [Ensete ventricosum]